MTQSQRSTTFRGVVLQSVWAHLPVFIIFVLYLAAIRLFSQTQSLSQTIDGAVIYGATNLLDNKFAVALVVGLIVVLLARGMDSRSGTARRPLSVRSIFEVVVGRIAMAFFLLQLVQLAYLGVKPLIPAINPFSWDHTFAVLDRGLFLGADPWRLTHWLFPTPAMTGAFDGAYVLWFFVLFFGQCIIAVAPLHSVARLATMLSLVIGWVIVGTVLALIFSSAGPVYVEPLFGDTTFVPLVERLEAQNETVAISALDGHAQLWSGYIGEGPALGISAFPSLHVYLMVVLTCAAFRVSRWLGAAMVVMCIMIFVGSVHLAWHYAVDGIASVFLALAIWRLSYRFSGQWIARMPAEGTD